MINNFEEKVRELTQKVKQSRKICVVSHIHPDGDSIGSLLAFGLALKNIEGKEVKFALTDNIPENLTFLPGTEYFTEINENDKFDVLVTLDCSDLDRLGNYKNAADKADFIVNIDHHITNTNFGNLNIVKPKASSTGEVVFEILEAIGLEVTKEIATCIYVAISTDTGSFRYDNTTSKTHNIVAKLIDKGIDINTITVEVYQSKPLRKIKLFNDILDTLDMFYNDKLAVVMVTNEMLRKNKADLIDADDVVEYIRDINTVEVACILKEISNKEIKIGLRSKKYVDVSKIAKVFNGGGHIKASGCTINGDIYEAKKLMVKEIQQYLR